MGIIKTRRDATITIGALSGGAFNEATAALKPGAYSLEIDLEAGDFTWNAPGPTIVDFLDRDEFTDPPQVRKGTDQPCTVSFSKHMDKLTDSVAATLLDIINQTGYVGANWPSTMGSAPGCAEVFTVDILYRVEATDHCETADMALLFKYVTVVGGGSEGTPNSITFNGVGHTAYPIPIEI